MTQDSVRASITSRRSILAAALGGLGAWLAGAAASVPVVRGGVDGDVVLGAANAASGVTTIAFATDDAIVGRSGAATHSGVWGDNTGGGYGVAGSTSSALTAGVWGSNAAAGTGVRGDAAPGGVGVKGLVTNGTGVQGEATGGIGVGGTSSLNDAIVGVSNAAVKSGVWGTNTGGGYGVAGSSGGAAAAGVWGSNSGKGTGVRASSIAGRALDVVGKAHFSRSGKAVIAIGTSSVKVNLAGVAASSLVFANLSKNVPGRYVTAVVPAAGAFRIYLNAVVAAATPVVWFVLDS